MSTSVYLFPQEPPKEDLTVSEKFQLVLDVAQKAQVGLYCMGRMLRRLRTFHHSRVLVLLLTESVWEDGEHPGENQEVGFPTFFFLLPGQRKLVAHDVH